MGLSIPLSFSLKDDAVLISIYTWLKSNGGFSPNFRRWIIEGFSRDYPEQYAMILQGVGQNNQKQSRSAFLKSVFPPLNAYHTDQLNVNGVKMPIHRAIIDKLITIPEAYPCYVSAHLLLNDISAVPAIEEAFQDVMRATKKMRNKDLLTGKGVEIAIGRS